MYQEIWNDSKKMRMIVESAFKKFYSSFDAQRAPIFAKLNGKWAGSSFTFHFVQAKRIYGQPTKTLKILPSIKFS